MGMEINLLPRVSPWVQYRWYAVTGLVVLMAVIVGAGVEHYWGVRQEIDEFQMALSQAQAEVQQTQSMIQPGKWRAYNELAQKADQVARQNYNWTALLDWVTSQLPQSAALLTISSDQSKGQIQLHGRMDSIADIADYMYLLRKNSSVTDVSCTSVVNQNVAGNSLAGYLFDMTVTLSHQGGTAGGKVAMVPGDSSFADNAGKEATTWKNGL
jgi:Tfp pilus assembly protein PilN